ncbi:hypothetical protein D3C86_1950870 [compost metagenome]
MSPAQPPATTMVSISRLSSAVSGTVMTARPALLVTKPPSAEATMVSYSGGPPAEWRRAALAKACNGPLRSSRFMSW